MSDGTLGISTSLAGATAGTIGNIISITLPNQTRDSVETTTMGSTSNFREFIPGLLNAGEISVELNYDGSASGNADSLQTALETVAEVWTIKFPDDSTFVCSGFITSLGGASPMDDKITQSVTIKLTGKPTFTEAEAV